MPENHTQFPVLKIDDPVCDEGYTPDPSDCYRFWDYNYWVIKWPQRVGWLAAFVAGIVLVYITDPITHIAGIFISCLAVGLIVSLCVQLYRRSNEAHEFSYRNRYFLANREGIVDGSTIEFNSMPWTSVTEIGEDNAYVYFLTNKHPLPIPTVEKSNSSMGFSVPKRIFKSPGDAVQRLREMHRNYGQSTVNPLLREELGEPIASVSFQPEASEIKRLFDFIQNGYTPKSKKMAFRYWSFILSTLAIGLLLLADFSSTSWPSSSRSLLADLGKHWASIMQIVLMIMSLSSTWFYANRAARNPHRSVGVTAAIYTHGLYVEGPGIISASAWKNVKTVYDDNGVLLICFYNKTGYAIPSRIFSSEAQYKRFMRTVNAIQRERLDLLELAPEEAEASWPPMPKTLA